MGCPPFCGIELPGGRQPTGGKDILKFTKVSVALKNLKRNSFRTGILVLAIATLVSLLLFATLFTMSVSSAIRQASDRLGADLVIVPMGARGFAEEFLLESKNKSFYMPQEIIEKVKSIEGIEAATYQTYLESIAGLCCDVGAAQIVAFDQESDFIIKPWLESSLGRTLKKGEAIAGFDLDENLELGLIEVERTIFNNKFKIAGVLDKTGTGLDNALFMSDEDLQGIIESGNSPLKTGNISVIFAKIKHGFNPYHVGLDIEGRIIEVDVVARREMGGELLSKLGDINKIFMISTIMAAVLTIFLVWAIFSAIANERTQEIGIMRAVGAKESQVVQLFILEVVVLGALGSILGMFFGVYLFSALTKSFTLLRDVSAVMVFDRSIFAGALGKFAVALGCFFVGTGVCIAGALGPINRIKKLEPLISIKGPVTCQR
jgi:putative ABC transport system permease protein